MQTHKRNGILIVRCLVRTSPHIPRKFCPKQNQQNIQTYRVELSELSLIILGDVI